ncbi:MAG: type IV toxin-antitoxin system AbiEi family antitoxin domain-containing protein [Phycisphaerales bacterium]
MTQPRKSSTTLRQGLHALAASQGGYFTASQATEVGYDRRRFSYHVEAGNFERAGHGLYRLTTLPLSEHDQLVRLSLWSRGRDDQPQAVISHETALGLHDLGELIPSTTHLTVPRAFRKRSMKGVVFHTGTVPAEDRSHREGFDTTSPLRTLLDVAAGSTVPQEQLDKAVAEGLDRGMVRKSKLLAAIRNNPRLTRLALSLKNQR